jgi:ATP-dependent RNA helicase SUPV3L1/SUV3
MLLNTFTKREISVILNVDTKDVDSFIKKNKIEHLSKKHVGGTYYTYNLYSLTEILNHKNFDNFFNIEINKDKIVYNYITFFENSDKKKELLYNKVLSRIRNKQSIDDIEQFQQELLDKELAKKLEKKKREERTKFLKNTIFETYTTHFQNLYFNEEKIENIQYIIHVGETNSGKTYHAVNDLKESGGIYLAPLRLLAWECFEKLNNEKDKSCDLITGEEEILNEGSKIISATVEMFDPNVFYNTVILDEAFMLNDKDRGKNWLRVLLNTNYDKLHIICNNESLNLITTILKTLKRDNIEIKKYEKLVPLEVLDQSIIKTPPKKSVLVCFSRINVLKYKYIYEKRGYEVSVLYGNLPPEIKKNEISKFIKGETDICISTDVIGMGLNLPCDYVIFLENQKFDGITNRNLTNTEYKQIAGRSGRYKLSEKGFVYSANVERLKNALLSNNIVKNTYIGFDFNAILTIDNSYSMKSCLETWYKSDFIPESLTNIMIKEDISKYLKLINENVETITKRTPKIGWSLIYLPVKDNNYDYYNKITGNIFRKTPVLPPILHNINISDVNSLKNAG